MATDDDLANAATDAPASSVPAATPSLDAVDRGRYTDRKQLGAGGMGKIVTAFDRRLGRTVAIKELHGQDSELVARFEREIALSAKLEHPAIVTIHDAGVWDSGEPFYVMRLVPGRSLADAIAAASDLPARLALVPNVIAVADALAYAHGKRIIHRDLKPHNVMIGEFGETVVIDWGLAKEVTASRASATSIPTHSAQTQIGDVLGTPAYMPPEQAVGASTDARADVYAIGAILYHVLAGKPPYDGASTTEVLDHVKLGAPAELAVEAPPDLLAIVRRAMARKADDRYPSARELADDLRAFQAGRLVGAHRYSAAELFRRWIKKYRAAIGVAAIALVALAGVGAASVYRIIDARHVAEQNRAQAEGLVDFVVTDLSQKMSATGNSSLLLSALDRVSAYFAARAPETPADRQRYAAFRDLYARVLLQRGETARALSEGRAAKELVDELVLQGVDVGVLEVRSAIDLADARVQSGDSDGAVATLRAAIVAAERSAASHPEDVERLRELATAHGQLGATLTTRGEGDAARGELTANLELGKQLLASHPGDASFMRFVVVAHEHLSLLESTMGHTEVAIAHCRAMLEILATLSARSPDDVEYKHDTAVAHGHLGEYYRALGDNPKALAEYAAAAALGQALVERDPGNADIASDLVDDWLETAKTYMKDDKVAPARVALDKALAIARPLAARDPTNEVWTYQLSSVEVALGDIVADTDRKTAIASYRDAVALRDRLASAHPKNIRFRKALGYAHVALGETLTASGDKPAARAELQAGLAIYQGLVVEAPDDDDAKQGVDEARTSLAAASK